jgi:hypothetical protein
MSKSSDVEKMSRIVRGDTATEGVKFTVPAKARTHGQLAGVCWWWEAPETAVGLDRSADRVMTMRAMLIFIKEGAHIS